MLSKDEIILMAREAGFEGLLDKAWGIEQLERFFNLAFAAGAAHEREKDQLINYAAIQMAIAGEREACAKVCEEYDMDHIVGQQLAAAIRARGEK